METAPSTTPQIRLLLGERTDTDFRHQVLHAGTGEPLGQVDIRYGVKGQAFPVVLNPGTESADFAQGIKLDPPLMIDGIQTIKDSPLPWETAARHQLQESPLSAIGWMEGCILEGMWHQGVTDSVLKERLRKFVRLYGGAQGLEGTLPVASLARLEPDHSWVDACLNLWRDHQQPDGSVTEGGRIVAESCLTVAYPLAVISRQRSEPALAEWAMTQLNACTHALLESDAILLRKGDDGTRVFPNWSRALGWFLLGHAMTLQELDAPPDLTAFEQAVDLALNLQAPDGLWRSFADDPECGPETSGSCAIAAALFRASERLPHRTSGCRKAVTRALEGLKLHRTSDGFLGGATQHNCGGEALQRGTYRVIHPYVLGLYFLI